MPLTLTQTLGSSRPIVRQISRPFPSRTEIPWSTVYLHIALQK